MIRPFHLRDLALVHRLSEQGVSLHTESALIDQVHPLRGALYNLFVGGEFPTFVWKAGQGDAAGFIQLFLKENTQRGYILYLSATPPEKGNGKSSAPAVDEKVWLALLDQAVMEAGQNGIHSLVAEVNETGPELPVLRRAGFAVYTRQDIWILKKNDQLGQSEKPVTLKARQSVDDWDVQLLYANLVPRLVQLVEPMPPLHHGKIWVLREGGELTAFVHLHEGSIATWLRLFIHPNAEARVDEIVTAVARVKPPQASHPMFCCVPRYQSWLQGPLERAGFTFWGSQAVMVKHTVHHPRKPLSEVTTILETQGLPASSPIVHRIRKTKTNGKTGG